MKKQSDVVIPKSRMAKEAFERDELLERRST